MSPANELSRRRPVVGATRIDWPAGTVVQSPDFERIRMDSRDYLELVKRDAIVVDAIYCALYAMQLTNGSPILMSDSKAVLTFEYEIAQMQRALRLLVGEQSGSLPPPRRRPL
jgi:7-keto-8-aminopelargonate synthetase-like enzyme